MNTFDVERFIFRTAAESLEGVAVEAQSYKEFRPAPIQADGAPFVLDLPMAAKQCRCCTSRIIRLVSFAWPSRPSVTVNNFHFTKGRNGKSI
jgi:hypothetical protein